MLWVDPPEDRVTALLRAGLWMGSEVPLTFGVFLAIGSSDAFLKKPAIDV